MKMINLEGKQFGYLTVERRAPNMAVDPAGNVKWECRCACGEVVTLPGKWLRAQNNKSCGCKQYADRPMVAGAKSKVWTGHEGLPGTRWNAILRGAKQRKIPVKITIKQAWEQFTKQDGKCALSGIPIKFFDCYDPTSGTASMDRIDHTKGYVVGNVQWVHRHINMMKWKLGQELFIALCKKVANNCK